MPLVWKVLKERIAWLEATNEDLSRELHEYRSCCAVVEQCEIDSQVREWNVFFSPPFVFIDINVNTSDIHQYQCGCMLCSFYLYYDMFTLNCWIHNYVFFGYLRKAMSILRKVRDLRETFRVWTHLTFKWMKSYQVITYYLYCLGHYASIVLALGSEMLKHDGSFILIYEINKLFFLVIVIKIFF